MVSPGEVLEVVLGGRSVTHSALDLAIAKGWDVTARSFGAEGRSVRSFLIPQVERRFAIVINSDLQPTEAESDWLVAHELAHSAFYDVDRPLPRRRVRWRPEEEALCDRVADVLTAAPDLASPIGGACNSE